MRNTGEHGILAGEMLFRTAALRPISGIVLLVSWCSFVTVPSQAQIQFQMLDRDVVEMRLQSVPTKNDKREAMVKQLFAQSGCKADNLSEQIVKSKLPPNVICVLPGETDAVILVGAHSDKVDAGDGVADNWSGASLLPSLLYSLSGQLRRHTFVFVSFTAEEGGMVGSDYYVRTLTPGQRSKIAAMVNLDTLGLGPTAVWATHSDKQLLDALVRVANATHATISAVNVDDVGSTDAESFAKYKIPRTTIHSVTQETWPILHSSKDKLGVIKMDDYYSTYHLLAAYLAFLDTALGQPAVPASKPAP